MGEYLCENLFFKIMNINDIENGEVYFNIKDLTLTYTQLLHPQKNTDL